MPACDDITRLLHAIDEGHPGAMDDLMETVYADLERVARRHMDRQFGRGLPGVTLEPAALVNESFLRLIRQRKRYANREQFFAIATRVMLRVLIDYQRQRLAAKRGGSHKRITLSLEGPAAPADDPGAGTMIGVATLMAAVDELESLDRRKADVVKLRVIWGLEMREIAAALNVSLATVERDWSFAKAWLARAADTAGSPDEAGESDEAESPRPQARS
jgi:RNA polymerase sigma factor (TIGR02999 family)